jgi:hypothetical protein
MLEQMNTAVVLIFTILSIIGMIIVFTAWFIRLEAAVKSDVADLEDYKENCEKDRDEIKDKNQRASKELWNKVHENQHSIQQTLNQMLITMGELKGRLDERRN